jgi:hypothetical protein
MVFQLPSVPRLKNRWREDFVHTLLFSVVLGRNLTSFSPLSTHIFMLLLPLWFRFSFPPSLVVPTGLLHTFFCHGFSHYWHSLTLLSPLGFKRDACSWVGGLLYGKEGMGLLHAAGWILGKIKGLSLSLSPCIYTPFKWGGVFGVSLEVFLTLFWLFED